MSKTPWFEPGTNPVHRGVYECTWYDSGHYGLTFQHWNGQFWGYYATKASIAYANRAFESSRQYNYWRGLSEKPA